VSSWGASNIFNLLSISYIDTVQIAQLASSLHNIGQGMTPALRKGAIMKILIGKNMYAMELSAKPFAWFQGETERMRLFSLSLLFVQFSMFASRLGAY
jgi:hypothetical protein